MKLLRSPTETSSFFMIPLRVSTQVKARDAVATTLHILRWYHYNTDKLY